MSTDETGLNLFHDNASAAGNFPTALRGYDRSSVDEYVRTLERRGVEIQQRNRDLDGRVRQLEDELAKAQKGPQRAPGAQNMQATGRAADVLRTADEESRELVKRAQLEAKQILDAARGEAASTKGQADRSVTEYQTTQRTEIDGLRKRIQADAIAQVTKARDEAATIVAAARREADAGRLQATQEIDAHRENSRLQAGAMLAQAQREVADLRAALAKEREEHTTVLKTEHDTVSGHLAGLLTQAQQFHAQSGEQLAKDTEDAARIRTEALAEAERTRIRVARESEDTINNAKRQAAALQQRMHEQFTQGKERLRRETDLLNDRKKAVLAQLTSLSEWAQQGASGFPDIDPDEELAELEKAFGSDSGQTDGDPQGRAADAESEAGTTEASADDAPADRASADRTESSSPSSTEKAAGPGEDDDDDKTSVVSRTTTSKESTTSKGGVGLADDDEGDADATVIRPRGATS